MGREPAGRKSARHVDKVQARPHGQARSPRPHRPRHAGLSARIGAGGLGGSMLARRVAARSMGRLDLAKHAPPRICGQGAHRSRSIGRRLGSGAMNIIGLGKAGCAIAEGFSKYPQYKTFYIDLDRRGENNYTIEKQQGPEKKRLERKGKSMM